MKFAYITGFISFEVRTMSKPFQLLRREFPLQALLAPVVLPIALGPKIALILLLDIFEP